MATKYDVVVCGAGNAGISAAVKAAVEGKKVLLIDQHNLPGGAASSFRRGRFEFDPSVHEICDFGPDDNKGHVRLMMERNGINVDWITVPDCYRCISKYSDGTPMDITMPSGREPFIDKMEEYVPGTREKMNTFFDLLEEVRAAVVYMNDGTPNDSKYMQEHFPNTLRTCGYDALTVLKKALKLPDKAIDILSVYWCYLGVPLDQINFLHFGNMLDMYITRKAVIPHHTSHEISMVFMKRFYELGGEAWFNCRAEEFLFDGDHICGVKTSLGVVECDQVLANINPDMIYAKMMPKELVPEREKKLSTARNHNYAARMFLTYVALNKTYEELGIKDYTCFMPGTCDTRKEFESFKHIDTNEFIIMLCYNKLIPDFSPEGTCVLSFTAMYGPEDWNNLEPQEYYELKDKIAKKQIQKFKEVYGVDIEPYIEEIEMATPMTFSRYMGTPEGSTYGFDLAGWDGMLNRMMNIPEEFPVKGLRHIGAASFRGDGYSSTWINGDMCAAMACAELKEGGNK